MQAGEGGKRTHVSIGDVSRVEILDPVCSQGQWRSLRRGRTGSAPVTQTAVSHDDQVQFPEEFLRFLRRAGRVPEEELGQVREE